MDIKLKTIPFVSPGLPYGGTPEENAANYMKMQTEKQLIMNNKYGGGYRKKNKSHKLLRKRSKKYMRSKRNHKKYKTYKMRKNRKMYRLRGGEAQMIQVPQFGTSGLNNSTQNSNSASLMLNKLYVDSVNNNRYDCYATNSCNKTGGSKKYKLRKRNNRNKTIHKMNKRGRGCSMCDGNSVFLTGGNKKCNCTKLTNKIKNLFRY